MCVTGLEPGCFDLQKKVTGVKRRGQVLQKYRKLVRADGKQRENRPREGSGPQRDLSVSTGLSKTILAFLSSIRRCGGKRLEPSRYHTTKSK